MALNVYGGRHEFYAGEVNFTSIHGFSEGTKVLGQNACIGAVHDSAERCDAPKCHPETRVAIQDEAVTWLHLGAGKQDTKRMRWINGPAGSGKTAIMGSVAERCEKEGFLAASFFFSAIAANPKRQSKRFLIPTIAYQLAQHNALTSLASPILSAVERYPDIFEKNLDAQAKRLILDPLRQASVDRATCPPAIIIDGLDECRAEQYLRPDMGHGERNHYDDQHEILLALAKLVQDPIFPFRILIAGRPDPALYEFFHGEGAAVASIIVLNKSYAPDKDIELYLKSRFSEIRLRYNLGVSWPAHDVLPTLVKNSSSQFVYPSVIMRFIDDNQNPLPPPALLEIVMHAPGSTALAPLDAMYTAILKSAPDPVLAVTWIRAIRWHHDRFYISTAGFSSGFLETTPGQADKILGPLRSLIKIPSPDEVAGRFSFYHKSFLDYLDDPARSRGLYVDFSAPGNGHTLRFENFMFHRFVHMLQRPTSNYVRTSAGPGTNIIWGLFFLFDSFLVPIANQTPDIFISEGRALLECRIREWGLQGLSKSYYQRSHTLDTLSKVFECVHASVRVRLLSASETNLIFSTVYTLRLLTISATSSAALRCASSGELTYDSSVKPRGIV